MGCSPSSVDNKASSTGTCSHVPTPPSRPGAIPTDLDASCAAMRDICLPPLALRSPPLAGEPGSGRGSSLKARLVVMCSWRLERLEVSAACRGWGWARGARVGRVREMVGTIGMHASFA